MYALATPYDRYKQQGVMTANPVDLIVMLYDGCIKQLKLSSMAIEDKDFDKANVCMQKAEEIIMELINSLDFHYPIANELLSLYDFVLNEMIQINMEKETTRMASIIDILSSLRDSWSQISKESRGTVELIED